MVEEAHEDRDDELPVTRACAAKRAKREKMVKRGTAIGGGASSASAGVRKEKGAPGPAAPVRPGSAAAAGVVAVEDTDALDCGVCYLPLKPPIFQCHVGHVVCSPCCDKLKATGKCHVCGIATGGYSRCHAMERLVESIRVPCPNAAQGCTIRPAYYDQHDHRHCPGEACGFVGTTTALWDHFSGVHSWACKKYNVSIQDLYDRVKDGIASTTASTSSWLTAPLPAVKAPPPPAAASTCFW